MNLGVLVLRRRCGIERRVLRIVRGDITPSLPASKRATFPADTMTSKGLTAFEQTQFTMLRKYSLFHGLKVQLHSCGAPYLTVGEALILQWLAEAQRNTVPRVLYFKDADLYAAIIRCALILKRIGLLLPQKTLKMDLLLHEKPSVMINTIL